MGESMPDKKDVEDRFAALEAELARARRVGRIALAVAVVGLVTAGIAVGWQWRPSKTVRAARFEVVDSGGGVRGVWSVGTHGSELMMLSKEGRSRLALRSSAQYGSLELNGPGEGPALLKLLATKGTSHLELASGAGGDTGRGIISLFTSDGGRGSTLEMSSRKGDEFRSVSLSSSEGRTGLRVGSIGRDRNRAASASLDLLSGEGRLVLSGPASDSVDKARPISRSATLGPGGLSLWRKDGGEKRFELGPPPRAGRPAAGSGASGKPASGRDKRPAPMKVP